MKTSIDMVWITVRDLEKAVEFYTKSLGFVVHEMNRDVRWAELRGSQGGIFLGMAENKGNQELSPGKGACIAITVFGMEAAIAELEANQVVLNGKMIEIPGKVKIQAFRDSEGNLFQLAEPLGEQQKK